MELHKKIDGYRRKISLEWNLRRHAFETKKRNRIFDEWLTNLTAKSPQVLVGANCAWGGVRHHVQAIERFSSLAVGLVPGEELFNRLGADKIDSNFFKKFSSTQISGVKVVHSHVFPWFIEWCREQQEKGLHWVHTYHLNYYPDHSAGELEVWQQEINRTLKNVACHADICLSVSKWQVEELQREHGITTQYLPNGVDVEICDATDASRFTRIAGLENFILYVGRNDPVKNPVDFIHLAYRLPEFRFVMIGGGLSDDCLRNDCQLEIPNNLQIFGGMSQSQVQDAIAACATLVVTSKREGLPTLVMEAMCQRKPVVVPDEAGCMEVIGHGEAGLIYENGNIDDLAQKTLKALADSELGNHARKRVLAKYDWRVIAPRLDAIYRG